MKKIKGGNNGLLNNEIIENLKIEYVGYTENKVINHFLATKKLEIKKINAQTFLTVGKIFQEVKDKVGGANQYDGVYVKWLSDVGSNKMTALRMRNRYKLYNVCKTEVGKITVISLSNVLIQGIAQTKGDIRYEILRAIDSGATREEIAELLEIEEQESESTKPQNKKEINIYDFSDAAIIGGIINLKELENYQEKLKEFNGILKIGKDLLLNRKVELSNKDNEFKKLK